MGAWFGISSSANGGSLRADRPTNQTSVDPRHTTRRGAPGANVGTIAVNERVPRPKLSELAATLIVGTERFELTGRSVLILAARAQWMNQTPVGRVVADFAHSQVKLRLTESLPSIHCDP